MVQFTLGGRKVGLQFHELIKFKRSAELRGWGCLAARSEGENSGTTIDFKEITNDSLKKLES